MMRYITIFTLNLLPFLLYSQPGYDIYSMALGNYKCLPDFRAQQLDTTGFTPVTAIQTYHEKTKTYEETKYLGWQDVLSTLVADGDLYEAPIYFPLRTDTIRVVYPDGETITEIKRTDHNTFINIHDSICITEIDSLLNSELIIICNDKKQKIIQYDFQVMDADGRMFSKTLKRRRILDDRTIRDIAKTHKIIYIGVFNIQVKRAKKTATFYEGYGWKIKNCQQ